jgi:hypothetical protein
VGPGKEGAVTVRIALYDCENIAAVRRNVVGRLEFSEIIIEIPANLGLAELKGCSDAVAHTNVLRRIATV